ncbi:MAG TPA: heavy-metal-associated domain-containing protein [Gordonia sp. (in: high G+C Gram-positive bacteria)]|uniref:heavy-metal-associated domain-containing protein n=1 Tax=unclassified Gordonia (in: high G+C Gram-positive bacteria) TaxID=2657482 RepID=UPI000FB6188E|nr:MULTISPECIES: heavy-metal-associated domain-containing protein [unclassified Gordonia (in: high G+C Gram-positive bacteria)]RUP36599.1 MAG: copper chaperone [Gordonia sp. (in: high G+C Gram-positive bacteria)]HNP56008.1 heavy-metal-associated domain-containing protein [Gordonia sp. (in: high G+C Gram-positive bacteria)]HRC51919.1 heavy-metal-associated domain-containing protein [Gordonia sp. (in: high G+C Gram-positive bacteria)]
MSTVDYLVKGMTCGHCEMSVREEVGEVPGVTDVDVSAATGELTVTADRPIDDDAVLAAVAEAGYTATRV